MFWWCWLDAYGYLHKALKSRVAWLNGALIPSNYYCFDSNVSTLFIPYIDRAMVQPLTEKNSTVRTAPIEWPTPKVPKCLNMYNKIYFVYRLHVNILLIPTVLLRSPFMIFNEAVITAAVHEAIRTSVKPDEYSASLSDMRHTEEETWKVRVVASC